MPRVVIKPAFRVDIVEYERGWGQKLDETLYFDNELEARDFATNYNTKYNLPGPVPDWYMVAEYRGEVK